jgi:magnesium-transporting ATPase (P-type)
MNQPSNPFAGPTAQQPAYPAQKPTGSYIGVELDQLVLQHGAVLPQVCVKTNQPATRLLKRKFHWHHPALTITILGGLLIYVILVLILRKSMEVNIPMSEEAFAKRKKWMWINVMGMILCLLAVIGSIFGMATLGRMPPEGMLAMYICLLVLSFIGLLVFAIVNGRIANVLAPKKITDMHGWFRGCHPDYLQGIKAAHGQPASPYPVR